MAAPIPLIFIILRAVIPYLSKNITKAGLQRVVQFVIDWARRTLPNYFSNFSYLPALGNYLQKELKYINTTNIKRFIDFLAKATKSGKMNRVTSQLENFFGKVFNPKGTELRKQIADETKILKQTQAAIKKDALSRSHVKSFDTGPNKDITISWKEFEEILNRELRKHIQNVKYINGGESGLVNGINSSNFRNIGNMGNMGNMKI